MLSKKAAEKTQKKHRKHDENTSETPRFGQNNPATPFTYIQIIHNL